MEHIHFIGIGGTGLSAIAKVLLEQGYQVSGSDLTASPLMDGVKQAGAVVHLGHKAAYIQGADLVVRSSAVPDSNEEVQAALSAGIPVLRRSEFLDRLMEGKKVLAVAGSHGKTTTTSMLAWILSYLGQDPSYIVGGVVADLGTNAHAGHGDVFVIEADEYDGMFLGLDPDLAVVTNVEHDHPDIYPTVESFREAFISFVKKLQPGGKLILCGEDAGASSLTGEVSRGQSVICYGFENAGKEYIARDLTLNGAGAYDFELISGGTTKQYAMRISLQVPGLHNVLNATAAFAAAEQLGMQKGAIAEALNKFSGSERRFDVRGTFQGVVLIDDYGHHPTEIRSTLAAARTVCPEHRLRCLWQPHTYSRTTTLLADYKDAFNDADELVVLDVYEARETRPVDFSMQELVNTLDHPQVKYFPEKQAASDYFKADLRSGDVLLVFSAGDAIEISQDLESYLSGTINDRRGEMS
jgi:UDP-N-acetylmuramate--alanine ligase